MAENTATEATEVKPDEAPKDGLAAYDACVPAPEGAEEPPEVAEERRRLDAEARAEIEADENAEIRRELEREEEFGTGKVE